jgi:hypothetical protein
MSETETTPARRSATGPRYPLGTIAGNVFGEVPLLITGVRGCNGGTVGLAIGRQDSEGIAPVGVVSLTPDELRKLRATFDAMRGGGR